MHKDLENFNIIPRKTYDLEFEFPFEKIPNKYLWDFIRGFFDGILLESMKYESQESL